MVILISESEAMQTLPSLLDKAQTQSVIITNGQTDLGAIVSMEDFAAVRKAKGQRALEALKALGEDLRAGAEQEGMSLEELEMTLDRKAPKTDL
jgi:hypothetical protein